MAEVGNRAGLGEGLLDMTVYGVQALNIINPVVLDDRQTREIVSTFACISQRPIRSVFDELGFEVCSQRPCKHPEHPYEYVHPEALTLEQVRKNLTRQV